MAESGSGKTPASSPGAPVSVWFGIPTSSSSSVPTISSSSVPVSSSFGPRTCSIIVEKVPSDSELEKYNLRVENILKHVNYPPSVPVGVYDYFNVLKLVEEKWYSSKVSFLAHVFRYNEYKIPNQWLGLIKNVSVSLCRPGNGHWVVSDMIDENAYFKRLHEMIVDFIMKAPKTHETVFMFNELSAYLLCRANHALSYGDQSDVPITMPPSKRVKMYDYRTSTLPTK
jgi:hypothetical protein